MSRHETIVTDVRRESDVVADEEALLHEAERMLRPRTAGRLTARAAGARGLASLRARDATGRSVRDEMAIWLFAFAALNEPREVWYRGQVAHLLQRKGRLDEAIDVCREAVRVAPENDVLAFRLVRLLHQAGRLDEAQDVVRRLGDRLCDSAEGCRIAGGLLADVGRLDDALQCCERAVRLEPQEPASHLALGEVLSRRGEWELATAVLARGVDYAESSRATTLPARLQMRVGEALLRRGRCDEARRHLDVAVRSAGRPAEALALLAEASRLLGDRSGWTEAQARYAQDLLAHEQFEEAEAAFHSLLASAPDSQRALLGLGESAIALERPLDAMRCYKRLLATDPDQPLAHKGLAEATRRAGDLVRAWDENERFVPPPSMEAREFEHPEWAGESLDGRTIVIWAESLLGDTIQFLRFLPLVKARGGQLIVEGPRALLPLIKGMPCVDQAIAYGTPLPAFDVQHRLTKLPVLFRTSLSDVPDSTPYLFVDEDRQELWRQRLKRDGRLTVGLTWGGGVGNSTAAARFTGLRSFAPLGHLDGVRFIAVQLAPHSVQTLAPPSGLHVEHLLREGCSIADTAALIQNLDLIITVDTMIAHLAGALARPVWTVIPRRADWRWFQSANETVWYPTMRLFRQAGPDGWTEVFGRVRAALERLVSGSATAV